MPLGNRPPVSLAAQRTIKDAFNNLQKSLSTTDRRSLQDTTLEEVRQAAKQIENQLAARQSLRNMRRLLPFFDGLSHYSKSIEVLCNGTPYMCWIWAPIKVILKVASDYTEAFERIIQGYSRIAEPLSRFEIIGETYSKNIHVQETLAIFYADILNFHQNAYKLVCRSGWTVLFLSSWGRFQRTFDGIFEDLKYHEALIDKTAAAVNISEAKAMRDTMELWRQEHLERIEKDNLDKALSNYSTVAGWLKFDETDQLRVSESISSEPQRYRGTTDWVTRNGKIASWMRPNHEKAFLMLHGHPGTGKSVLTTEIATFLRSANASLVITHFCTDSYAASTEHTEVLKSILVQLIRSNADLASHAYDELVRQKNSPSSRVLEKLIHDLVIGAAESPSQTRCIHVIVDGLNECTEVQQKEITKTLERIVLAASSKSSGLTICKVLLSTHTTHRLLGEIRNKQTMSLSEEKREVTKSIEQYASQRIARISARLRQIGITESDKQDLVRIIAAKADGMFLWARLVLDYLSTNIFYNREEILRAADSLPRKLSEFYGQIVAQLTAPLAEFSVERVKMTLSWIAFAKRPLKKAELLSALAFSDGNTTVSELPPAYIFEKCGPLVEMRNDSSFAFIHVSVKDFLKSPESNMLLSEDTAYYQHGLSTATCLLSGLKIMAGPFPESDRNLRILRGLHAFHTYATEYWTEYLLAVASSRTGLDMTSPFFSLSHQLAKALGNVPRQYNDSILNFLAASDERLVSLQGYPELHSVVVQSILDRGPKEMEERCEDEQDTINPVANVTSLKSLLLLYQSLIRRLLAMRTVAGIDLEDFERFKIEFRTTAFACRMLSCPRASLGFDSEAQLMEHEASHLGITCNVPECQYPPFSSNRALKMHQSKCHPTRETGVVRRRGIRRTRSKPLSDEYVSHANKSQPISRGEVFMSGDKSWKPLAPPPEHPYVTETWAEVSIAKSPVNVNAAC
ncbi:hypothetical protein QBC44DRAFT_242404 [Cladorrhinum sp. PSN332]|nr:hypothetical protein QBC44DRAFT_242404 [Cladorrhinum sp. PSN332]